MPFKKGEGGRKPGAQNKLTKAVKDAVQEAFDEVGGTEYLKTVAREDHKTFCALLGKVIPTQVNAELKGDVQVVFKTIIDGEEYEHGRDD